MLSCYFCKCYSKICNIDCDIDCSNRELFKICAYELTIGFVFIETVTNKRGAVWPDHGVNISNEVREHQFSLSLHRNVNIILCPLINKKTRHHKDTTSGTTLTTQEMLIIHIILVPQGDQKHCNTEVTLGGHEAKFTTLSYPQIMVTSKDSMSLVLDINPTRTVISIDLSL